MAEKREFRLTPKGYGFKTYTSVNQFLIGSSLVIKTGLFLIIFNRWENDPPYKNTCTSTVIKNWEANAVCYVWYEWNPLLWILNFNEAILIDIVANLNDYKCHLYEASFPDQSERRTLFAIRSCCKTPTRILTPSSFLIRSYSIEFLHFQIFTAFHGCETLHQL